MGSDKSFFNHFLEFRGLNESMKMTVKEDIDSCSTVKLLSG